MSGVEIGLWSLAAIVLLIYSGLHVAITLGLVSFVGIWIMRDNAELAARVLSLAARESISSYLFGVVPLFVLMGLVVSRADIGRDTFDVANRYLGRFKGGLGMSTVGANAIFASITGIVDYFFSWHILPTTEADYETGGTACPVPENTMALCTDNIDNDHNGFTDCQDLACQGVAGVNCTVDTSIVDIQIARVAKRLEERGIVLELDAKARAWLAEHGYDPTYGARPLKRVIQRSLENPLALAVLEGSVSNGSTVNISADGEGLVIDGKTVKADNPSLHPPPRAGDAGNPATLH